jgi:hypothetical protein
VLILLNLCTSTGLNGSLTAVRDLLQGDGPIGQAVQRSGAPTLKAACRIVGPLVVQVGEALPYVKEIIPSLKTLVDMYHEYGAMIAEHEAVKEYLDQIQV